MVGGHSASSRLPTFRLSTVRSRTFNVAGPRIWNELPEDVVSAPTFSSWGNFLGGNEKGGCPDPHAAVVM